MGRFLAVLKELPKPFPLLARLLEHLVAWWGPVRAVPLAGFLAIAAIGVVFGAVALISFIYFEWLPLANFGYLTKAQHDATVSQLDIKAAQEKEALNADWRSKVQTISSFAQRWSDRLMTTPVSPDETAIVDPGATVRFEWVGSTDSHDYVLSVVSHDHASARLVTRHIPITGRPQPLADTSDASRQIRYADVDLARLGLARGEFFWAVRDSRSANLGGNYRRFSLHRTAQDKIRERRQIDVGTSWIPDGIFMIQDTASKSGYRGFEAELLHRIAEIVAGPSDEPAVVIRHVEWDDLLTQLARHRLDLVISSMTRTRMRERNYRILFSDGYLTTHQRFIVREGETNCLKQMTIGVVGGNPVTTNQYAAQLLARRFGYSPSQIMPVRNTTELLRKLRDHTLDAGLMDDINAKKTIVNGADVTGLSDFIATSLVFRPRSSQLQFPPGTAICFARSMNCSPA